MYWYFNDVRSGCFLGTIQLPSVRLGITFIVDITRTDKGINVCINGEDIDVPFDRIVDTPDYKIRCYRLLNRLKLVIT